MPVSGFSVSHSADPLSSVLRRFVHVTRSDNHYFVIIIILTINNNNNNNNHNDYEQIINVISNRRMKQLIDWLGNPH